MEELDIIEDELGRSYVKKGTMILHRLDGPAWEVFAAYNDGFSLKEWLINGELHRECGPAREIAGLYNEWYNNDKLHRLNGPAVEWSDGRKEWWINGIRLSHEKENVMNTWWENGRV